MAVSMAGAKLETEASASSSEMIVSSMHSLLLITGCSFDGDSSVTSYTIEMCVIFSSTGNTFHSYKYILPLRPVDRS